MAYKNKIIRNSKTRQDILFLQTSKDTGGRLLEMETTYHARSKEPIEHYHPSQREDFTVLAGEVTVKVGGILKVMRAGDQLHIPAGTSHAMWNSANKKAVVNWKVQPAMHTEYLLETITGLAEDGKTDPDGKPGMLQIALTANKFTGVFRMVKPTYRVQKILFGLLTPFAYLAGYKAVYRQYLD